MQEVIYNPDHSSLNHFEFIGKCPAEFYGDNEWTIVVEQIKWRGVDDPSQWDWKEKNVSIQQRQFDDLLKLIKSDKYMNQQKKAAAAWYLSLILNTAPKLKTVPK